ncbi:MAG: HDIG domain-containing protein [Desulfuromonadales bacterium]
MTKSDKKSESSGKKSKKARKPSFFDRFALSEIQQRSVLIFVLAAIIAVIIVPKGGSIPDYYVPGDIVSRDIKAPRDLNVPDMELTEKRRKEAEAGVRPVYDYDPAAGQEAAGRLGEVFSVFRAVESQDVPAGELTKIAESTLGTELSEKQVSVLKRLAGQEAMHHEIFRSVRQALSRKIVANRKLFQADLDKGVVIRNLQTQSETKTEDLSDVIGIGQGQDVLRDRVLQIDDLDEAEARLLVESLGGLLRPNLTFNKNATEDRTVFAREEVAPVFYQIKKGEMIAREGERVTPGQIKKLQAMRQIGSDASTLRTTLGLLLCTGLLIFTAHRYAMRNVRKYRPDNRDLLFLSMTLIGFFILIKLAIFVSAALEGALPAIESTTYFYAFPFAIGAMLVRIVLNSEVALVFCMISALLVGFLFGNSLSIAIYALLGSLAGAHWVGQCKERTTLLRAGLWISLTNLALIVGLQLLLGRPFDMQLLYKAGFGVSNGFFCAVIVTGMIPIVEGLFKYTTDIKLLELANMNSPVLRELMIRAPGTYHHSVIVGNLVEAAAEEINANPLMARVAAYYHDIGKIRKPLYFIENVGGHENRHDKLAPSMSALVLTAHVKDGIEMAREAKLGRELIEIIRQHHGTALIKFFYDKAKSKSTPGVQHIDERDYRYPGPKPQTREAALIMLADAVEAASRTLTDPTPARIQGMVQKIINNIFIDGQLDECELTLKDMHSIAKSFNRILAGIFHHRVDYPEPAYKERDKESGKRKKIEDSDREPARETKNRETEVAKGSSDDLKRLGMS